MLHPLYSLFKRPERMGWQESDVRYAIQDFLRQRLNTDALYCDEVKEGKISIRVSGAAFQQEIRLMEEELKEEIQEKTNYVINVLKIKQ